MIIHDPSFGFIPLPGKDKNPLFGERNNIIQSLTANNLPITGTKHICYIVF